MMTDDGRLMMADWWLMMDDWWLMNDDDDGDYGDDDDDDDGDFDDGWNGGLDIFNGLWGTDLFSASERSSMLLWNC